VGNFAYRTRANLPMFVYDVTNPADPQLVSTLSTGYPLFECESSSQLLYIAAGDHPGGVVVLDVTHPAAPTLRSLYNLPGSLGDIALAGPWIYVANGEGGLLVLDAADPDTLKPYGSFNMPWWGVVQDVAVSGSYAYVASSDSGVQIVDLTNPILPVRVAGFKVAGRTGLVEAGGDRLYSTHTPVGMFHMRDLADPVAPVWFGQGGPIGDARSLAVAGRYLYLANGDLRIFDLEAQANIAVLVGTFITPGTAMDVSVAGDLAFVADSGQGLVIVDVADRAAPAQAGELDLPGPVRGVAVSGNTVCVASGLEGLHVIDVSVPASPVLTGTYNTPGYAHAVELDGDYAIVAAGYDGVQVINVSNPTTPYMYIAGTLNTMGESLDLTLVNGRVYIADRVQLLMVDVSLYSGGYTLGDVDESGDIASSDIIALVNFVFKGGPQPMPVRRAGDLNCDGPVSSTDVILLVNYVFKSAPSPVCP